MYSICGGGGGGGGQKIRNFPADEENTHEHFTVLITKLTLFYSKSRRSHMADQAS